MEKQENGLYVACGLTNAPEDFVKDVETLKDNLRQDYNILDFIGLELGTDKDVYLHDVEQVGRCAAMLAIADYPSTGMGGEIMLAKTLQKPTLAVVKSDTKVTRFLSGMAEVAPTVEMERYQDLRDVPDMLGVFLARHSIDICENEARPQMAASLGRG